MAGVDRLEKIFATLFDEREFLSPYGLRALSAYHRDHPYELDVEGVRATIDYEPAESTTAMFGGNSNWRGPLWFPLNYLVINVLERYYEFFGDDLAFEYPTGSGYRIPSTPSRLPGTVAPGHDEYESGLRDRSPTSTVLVTRSVRVVPVADACPIDFVRLWTVARKQSFLAPVPAAETREDGVPARAKVDQASITSAHLDRPFGPARRSLGWSSRNRHL